MVANAVVDLLWDSVLDFACHRSLTVLLRRRGFVALPSGFVISVTSTSVGFAVLVLHHVFFQA